MDMTISAALKLFDRISKKFHVNYKSQIRIFLIFLLIITAQSILNSIFTFPKGDQTNFLCCRSTI